MALQQTKQGIWGEIFRLADAILFSFSGHNFTALLTVSEESALAVAENYVLTVGVFHGLTRNFGFCACVFCVTKDSVLIA